MAASGQHWREFQALVGERLLLDAEGRDRYASDESIYWARPRAVLRARDEEDLREALAFARRTGEALTARAGGTSLAGQAVGPSIVVDISDCFERIEEVNVRAATARVQPGVVLAQLNAALADVGMRFGPDPSSMDSCRIGGMIANNASGLHHLMWGATVDNVRSLRLMLADGTTMLAGPVQMGSPEHKQRARRPGLEGTLWRELPEVLSRARQSLGEKWAHYEKSSSGYRMDKALEGNIFDPAKLICGSEGTLALVLEAELRIVERPKARGLLILYFASLEDAAKGVAAVVPTNPSAVELIDEHVVRLFRERRPALARRLPEGASCALFVEYMGASPPQVERGMLGGYRALREETGLAIGDEATTDAGTMESIWQLRRGVEPMLSEMAGARVPVGFVEDTAVPVARLAEHVRGLYAIFERHGLEAAAYGHASMGHLHVRPFLDLRDEGDRATMARVAREVFDQTRKLGGTMTGEHGDGVLRSEFLAGFFGPAYDAMVEIKRLFDPAGVLNPGIKVGAPPGTMLSHLRRATAPPGP